MDSQGQEITLRTNCHHQMKEGILDMTYLEHRLDSVEARIDDLCRLLGCVLEGLGVYPNGIDTSQPKLPFPMDLTLDERIWD